MSKSGLKYLKEKELKAVRKEIEREVSDSQQSVVTLKALGMCKEFVTQFEDTLEKFIEEEYQENKGKRQFADAIKRKLINGCQHWKNDVEEGV